MAGSSKHRQRLSTLLPIPENRQSKVCDISLLEVAAAAAESVDSQGKGSSRPGRMGKLKKAIVGMLASDEDHSGRERSGSGYNPGHGPAFFMGMGMVPIAADFGAPVYFGGYS